MVYGKFSFVETRYWSGRSSAYGTGDQLLGLLRCGWYIESIGRITHLRKSRRVNVYSFELRKADQMTVMHVVENPFIIRLVRDRWLYEYELDNARIVAQSKIIVLQEKTGT